MIWFTGNELHPIDEESISWEKYWMKSTLWHSTWVSGLRYFLGSFYQRPLFSCEKSFCWQSSYWNLKRFSNAVPRLPHTSNYIYTPVYVQKLNKMWALNHNEKLCLSLYIIQVRLIFSDCFGWFILYIFKIFVKDESKASQQNRGKSKKTLLDHIHAFCLNFLKFQKVHRVPQGYFSKIWVFAEKWLDIFFWPKLLLCATSCYSFDRMRASQSKIVTIFHILAKLTRSKQKVTYDFLMFSKWKLSLKVKYKIRKFPLS